MPTCVIDNSPHETLDALHKHLRKLKVKQEDYYTTYAPVRDRHTGEIIPFKAPAAEYLKKEFTNKHSLKAWFKAKPAEAKAWAFDFLKKRKADKGLIYAPSHVELRSLMSPTRLYFESLPGGYEEVCKELGFEYNLGCTLPEGVYPVTGVICDTREQKPLKLAVPMTLAKVNCGDYSLHPKEDRNVYIERKSLSDFLGTLSDRETREGDSNLERFIRELERAQEVGSYIVMLVESNMNDCLAYNSIPYLKKQFGHIKITPEHIFHNLRELLHRFPTSFQALFVENRQEAAAAVIKLFEMGEEIQHADLQYLYDTKKLVLNVV